MDEDKAQKVRSFLPAGMGAGFGALLILLFGRSVTQAPFEPTRPAERRLAIGQARPNMIDARLWEDPLRAVSDYAKGSDHRIATGAPQELRALLGTLPAAAGFPGQPSRSTVAVLAVALDGSSTPEATESRLRTRVAVISALAQRGLIPEGDGGLYLVSISSAKEAAASRSLPLAYEIFRFDPFGGGARHEFEDTTARLRGAVVVWLDEGAIAGDSNSGSVGNMAYRVAQLLDKARFRAEGLDSLRFLALAPVSSRLLSNVADDLAGLLGEHAGSAATPRIDRLIQAANSYLDEPLTPDERSQLERSAAVDGLADPGALMVTKAQQYFLDEATSEPAALAESAMPGGLSLYQRLRRLRSERAAIEPKAADLALADDAASGDAHKEPAEPKQLPGPEPSQEAVDELYDRAVAALLEIEHEDSEPRWREVVAMHWLTGIGNDAVAVRPAAAATPTNVLELQKGIRTRIEVFSPRATTPLALARLFDHLGVAQAGGRPGLGQQIAPRGAGEPARGAAAGQATVSTPETPWRNGLTMPPERFNTAVLADQELAASMVDELGRRGLSLVGSAHGDEVPRDHIVLVSEWDTLYGRALPFTFEVELTRRALGNASRYEDLYDQRLTNRIQAPPNVHRFSYLRGLDGETSDRGPEAGERNDDSDKSGGASSPGAEREARLRQLEVSEGPRQLDMIRRVGDSIATLDRNLRETEKGRVRAIGVLGSDFHDKLMVLQALRGQFDDAIFFTTDLDARLLQPRWYPLTRNVLVASSYGLELAPHLQCHTPPFRDSYATASFAAVLAGLQQIDPRPVHAGAENRPGACLPVTLGHLQRLRPLLFEVGRAGAIQLAPVDDRLRTHPWPPDPRPMARRIALLGFPLLIGIFWWLSDPLATLVASAARRAEPRRMLRLRWVLTGSAIAVVWLSWRVVIRDARGGGEPLFWLQGVSAWPSELVWVIGALLSVFLLARAMVALDADAALVAPYFVDPTPSGAAAATAPADATAPAAATAAGRWRWLTWLVKGWRDLGLRRWGCESADPAGVWESYCEAGQPRWRLARVAVSVIGVVALMAALAYLFGTTSLPLRSDVARAFHWVASAFATLSLMVLALFVFDATRLCVCFVDTLTQRDCARFPNTSRSVAVAKDLGMTVGEAGDLLTLRLVAERTEAVGRLLLYPFFVTAIFVVARSGMFDAWSWHGAVTALVVLILLILLGSGLHLQRSARRARQGALRRLEARRLRLIGAQSPGAGAATEPQLAAMREEVRALDRGAFASWSANPVFGALLLPFGGAGAAWIIDLLLQLGS